jgi:hypothetical protein
MPSRKKLADQADSRTRPRSVTAISGKRAVWVI